MTDERLAELRALAEAATPDLDTDEYPTFDYVAFADRALLKASRTAIPELLDEIQELREEVERRSDWYPPRR